MRSILSSFPTEVLKLHKKDHSIVEVTALVDGDKVLSDDVNVIIEEDDIYERTLSNGAKEYYRVMDRGFYRGNHGIPDTYQSKVEKIPASMAEKEMRRESEDNQHKLFISHSSKDKDYVVALAEMLEDIGMPDGSFICTSVPGHGIPGGVNIFDWLRNQFLDYDLRILYVLSHNYYESAASLNEMGAAWVLKTTDTILLLPGFDFNDIDGCIDPREMSISFGMEEVELKHRLNELKDILLSEHSLPVISQARWDRHRDKFIKTVKEIAAEKVMVEKQNTNVSNIPLDSFVFSPIQLHANVMLFFAAEGNGRVMVLATMSGNKYIADKRQLNESNDNRELAKWESALDQLIRCEYIKLVGGKDRIYQVTDKGYLTSDRFKNDNKLNREMEPSEVLAMFN